jgi:hypothetical protein
MPWEEAHAREQVDEKYKVGDGTESEGAKMQGGGHDRSVRSIYRSGETAFHIYMHTFLVIYEIIHFIIFVIMKFSVFFVILEKNKFCDYRPKIDHPIKEGCP